MSILKQVGLLTAGAQPWNSDICSANGNRFAYCSTLAIYIYEYDNASQKFKLHSIMCEHKKTITAICWQKNNTNIFASCSLDGVIIIWNVNEQKVVAKLVDAKTPITNIEWHGYHTDTLTFMSLSGPLFLWKYTDCKSELVAHKNSQNFTSQVCIFKWNLKDKEKVCYGHFDGSISICGAKVTKHILSTVNNDSSYEQDKVLSLEWDPLSPDYILVSTAHCGIRLIDTVSKNVITHFKLAKVECKIRKVCWMSTAPGMFISGDSSSAILRVWSVAQDTPIANILIKETGFHSLFLMETQFGNNLVESNIHKVTGTASGSLTLPPVTVVSVFIDGGLGIYDLRRRKWIYIREKGHIETIFACDFHPNDPNILATASFDGSIKVWDITTMVAIYVSPGNLSVIYSLSWSPGNTYVIFAATLKYGAILWDIESDTITKQFNDHGGKAVFSCCWSSMDPNYLVSSGADNQCIVRMYDGSFTKHYKHPGVVYGCDWCPSNRDLLATGCEDGIVRIYYIPGKSDPLKTFSGHTQKVFNVKWSPLKDGVLCSGSDDKTIRIWNYTQDNCIHCLEGHTSNIRGLLWSPELPNILISGSWDYSIRIWDTRTGYCLDVARDHAADVYGFACHPHRPFLLASTSRDSTLRLWTLHTIVQPLYASLVLEQNINFLLENVTLLGKSQASFGGISGEFMKFLGAKKEEPLLKKLEVYSHFLLPPVGISNFWVLVSIIDKKKKAVLPNNYGDMIMHVSHLTSYKASQAQIIETTKSNFRQLIGPKKKAEQLTEAARVYMSLGQTERYCEIMVELNKWEKALSVAPAVSLEYWKTLSKRYASILTEEEDKDASVYWMASQEIKMLCESLLERNQYHEAMLAVQVAMENELHITDPLEIDALEDNRCPGDESSNNDVKMLLMETNEALANWYFADGNPVLAACCHLSVDNVPNAICKLLRGNELELAYSLSKIFTISDELRKEITFMFSLRCEKYQLWDAAISLWLDVEDNELDLLLLCARHTGSDMEKNVFHGKAGLPTLSVCYEKASIYFQQGDLLRSCRFYSVSTNPEHAVDIAIKSIKDVFSQQTWTLSDVLPYSTVLGSIDRSIQVSKKVLNEVLAVSSYIGALQAIRFKYNCVVTPLFQNTIAFMNDDETDIGISAEIIKAECDAWLVQHVEKRHNGSYFKQKSTLKQKQVHENLMTKCGSANINEMCGEFIVLGHHFPGHTVSHIHYFTKERIKGPVFILENGIAALPHSFALMWAKVNMFSPLLGTGHKINPF